MAVAAAPFPALQAPLSSLQLLPLPSRSRRKPSPCPLIKIQCKDVDDRVWIIQRCPYSVEQLSSLLPGRQVISYAGLLSVAQAAHAHNGLGQHASDASGGISPSPSRLGFRSSLSSSSGRSKTGGLGGMHKRPSLSGSISSMSGLIGSGTGSTSGGSPLAAEILDTYTDKVDGLLRKIIRQRRDDDPAVRDWFDPGWGVPVESECTLDGCRLRHFQGLQRLPGPDTQRQISPPLSVQVHSPPLASSGLQAGGLISETGAVVDRNFSLDLGRFSPFDAGSQFHSPSSSLRSERFFESSQQQRRSQEALGVGAPPVALLGSFAEESVQPTAESTPRLPVSVESQVSTPRPEHDSPTETLYDSEGVVEAEVKWILENFPLPPPKAKALPTMAKRQMPVGHQRSRTPPQSPTSVEIRLRQASLTPSSTYSGMSALSRETDTTLATTVSTGWSSRSRGSTSTCASGRTDGSDGQVPSSRSSRDSGGPIALSNANVSGMRPSASSAGRTGDKTPRDGRTGRDLRPHSDESLVSPKTPSTSLPTVVDWRPKTPPPPPPTQLPSMQSRRPAAGPPAAPLPPPPTGPPPSKPPPPPPSASINDADLEERPFAALLKAESPLSLGDPIRLPTGPRQFSSVSVLPSSGSSPGLQAGRSPSPRKGSLLPTSSLEASPDGFRYHRPHQGMLNPYLRKSPSLSVSTLPSIHSAHSASSISPEASSMALPRSATTATLASPGGNVEGTKIFKVFIPSAERTISVSVGPNDSLLNLRDKIATKLRRTQLELPDKWSLATAQLSSTREKIVGDRELEALLAGRLRNGDPAQPCVLRVVEA